MGQHRKTKHYRRIVITALAIGAVGVPTAALACSDWPYGAEDQAYAPVTSAPVAQWQHVPRHHHRNVPVPATPRTSTPTQPPATTHPRAAKTATPQEPERTAAPSAPRATASASAAPVAPSAPKPTATASGVSAEIVRLVNAERAKAGCQALTLNSTLTEAAQAHSADMAAHQNMSHTGSDGSSPGDRITRAGYVWSSYGENVAYGYATAEQVMAGWMSSPGHRANILNCGFKEIGVGLAQPNSYWTQDFGTAR
ncbi:CAP domain-containing protein [Streptomyces sp. NPDC048521]|uniref:CAP domain-containing protein n=1 Tax=Streptomyces sp. NPDC048521 TaxID=3365566 RepID=UPI00371383B1